MFIQFCLKKHSYFLFVAYGELLVRQQAGRYDFRDHGSGSFCNTVCITRLTAGELSHASHASELKVKFYQKWPIT